MRRAIGGADPGKLSFIEFMDILRTYAQFRNWELGKGDFPTLDSSADANSDLKAMANAVPSREPAKPTLANGRPKNP